MTKSLIVPHVSGFEEIEASAGDVVSCIDRQEKSPDCTEAGFLIGHNDETPDSHGSESSGALVPSPGLRQIVSSFDIKGEIESIRYTKTLPFLCDSQAERCTPYYGYTS